MVDFTSDTLSGDIRRCILKKKMDLGNIGGFRVPKKALFSGFQPFFGHESFCYDSPMSRHEGAAGRCVRKVPGASRSR